MRENIQSKKLSSSLPFQLLLCRWRNICKEVKKDIQNHNMLKNKYQSYDENYHSNTLLLSYNDSRSIIKPTHKMTTDYKKGT